MRRGREKAAREMGGAVTRVGVVEMPGVRLDVRAGAERERAVQEGVLRGEAVREATTGRVVTMLPRVWAVSDAAIPKKTKQEECADEAEVAFYRKYTEALLRRYQRLKLHAGRVPSPTDRDVFRGRMSHYKVQGFDDAVIFCVDVERCLGRLNGTDQRLVRRIAVQEYSMAEAAGLLGMSLRSCTVLYRRALDRLTRQFVAVRLLVPDGWCQGAESD